MVAERHVRVLEFDNARLRVEARESAATAARCSRVLMAGLAARDDALDHYRLREEGITCACCAGLRLPDHFFPRMLSLPADSCRCVFCVQHVRAHYDLFGAPFTLPSGFAMPVSHPNDAVRLADLERCPACARMRHRDLFSGLSSALVLMLPLPVVLRKPVPGNAPRGRVSFARVCAHCLEAQSAPPPSASEPSAAEPSSSSAPLPSPAPDAASLWAWRGGDGDEVSDEDEYESDAEAYDVYDGL
jgi:hypothetical protein